MHSDQFDIFDDTISTLLQSERPDLAQLPRRRLPLKGTSNVMIRLGEKWVMRLPLRPEAAKDILAEGAWLAEYAHRLTVVVPYVEHIGQPHPLFPHPWLICRWINGRDAQSDADIDQVKVAESISEFLAELQAIPVQPLNTKRKRGGALTERDPQFRNAIRQCWGLTDVARCYAIWESALALRPYQGPNVSLHADLIPSNLLIQNGRLSGVIDFGMVSQGDPAWDLLPAWFLFDTNHRDRFRKRLNVNDATWQRGQAIAMSQCVIALPYYLNTNPAMVALARHGLSQVLDSPISR